MAKEPIGYYGIIIPHYNYYQGFFLYEDPEANHRLAILRMAPFSLSETKVPTPGVSDADQGLVGGLCATLVEGARAQNEKLLLRASAALSVLTNCRYFTIGGTIEPGGTWSDFDRMPEDVDSHIKAVAYIHSLPEVQSIQAHLLKEAAEQMDSVNRRK